MGLLDALLSNNSGGGLFDSLFYPTSAPDAAAEKKKQDAAFLAAIGQDPYNGVTNLNTAPPPPTGNFPNYGTSPLAGTNAGAYGGSSPFGLGGFNLPAASQGAPASGAFPAVPAMQAPQAPQAAPQMPQMAPPPMAAPAPQNGPSGSINVGSNYQMPQFGSRADYTPQASQPPSTDISAQGRQPDQSQALPSVLQTPSFLGRIGNPDGLIARLTGNDSRSISQQNLRATFDATRAVLLQSGMSNQEATSKAMLAVLNPEAGKTILPEALSNKEKYGVVSDNPLEGKKYGFINERDQTINGRPMGAGGNNGPSEQGQIYDAIAKARDAGATPAQLYQMVPAQFRAGVQAMIEGRALPTTFSARGGARDQALLLAQTIDPTLDEPAIAARSRGNVDFYGGGKSSETMRKANQSALHFGELVDKMQTLPGHAVPAYNSAANFINSELLGKDAKGNFIVNGHALADELSGLFKGAGISDTEIRAWESQLSPDMSEQQQRGMAKTLLGIYRDSVSALDKKRVEAVGPMTAAQKGPILGSEAEAALQKVESFANGKKTNAGGGIPSGWSVKER